MKKSFFLNLFIFWWFFSYSIPNITIPFSIKEPSLLNISFQYTILSTPIINESHFVIPIQTNKRHGILSYDIKLKKQNFILLKNNELILDTLPLNSNQAFFITSIHQKKNIVIYDLTTYKLTRINTEYKDMQFHFYTTNKVFFTVKNKNSFSFIILNLKTKKFNLLNKSYQNILQVFQINQDQAFAIVLFKHNQEQFIFIDFKKKIIKEDKNRYHSIKDINLISEKKAIAKLVIDSNKQKIGFIDLEKQLLVEASYQYPWMEYELLPNKNVIAFGYSGPETFIIFIDPFLNQIQEWPKKYCSIWGIYYLSQEKMIAFIEDEYKLTSCLQIDITLKNIKEIPISDKIYFPELINKQKFLVFLLDEASKQYALAFIDPFTLALDKKTEYYPLKYYDCETKNFKNNSEDDTSLTKKIEQSNIGYRITQIDNLGQGILSLNGNSSLYLLNIKNNVIHKVNKQYSCIEVGSFSQSSNVFGLAKKMNKIVPVLINFDTNNIKEFDYSYQKITTPLRTNLNGTPLASVLDYPNQEKVVGFDSNSEQVIEYLVKEKLNEPFNLKNIYSFQALKSENTYPSSTHDNHIVLVNDKQECVIKEAFYTNQTYFIPYKNQLIICPQYVENLNFKLD